jgi:RNA polymerase primary sigma factor
MEATVPTGIVAAVVLEDAAIRSLLDTVVREGLLDQLSERNQDIVRIRFGLDDGMIHTLDEISREFGVTTERVRQIVDKSLDKLRRLNAAHPRDDSAES